MENSNSAAPDAEVGELASWRSELATALRACTEKEQLLIRALPEHRHQIWRAGRILGYSKRAIQKMLTRPRFQRAIAALNALGLAALCVSERMILEEYVTLGTSSLQDFHDENGNALPPQKWPQELAGAVQEYYVDKDGVARIKLHEKGRALDALAKYKRLAPERVELTGKDGAPIQYEDSRDRNLRTLDQISARLSRAAPGETAGNGETSGDREDGSGGGA